MRGSRRGREGEGGGGRYPLMGPDGTVPLWR